MSRHGVAALLSLLRVHWGRRRIRTFPVFFACRAHDEPVIYLEWRIPHQRHHREDTATKFDTVSLVGRVSFLTYRDLIHSRARLLSMDEAYRDLSRRIGR
jgi:hypothetical protein